MSKRMNHGKPTRKEPSALKKLFRKDTNSLFSRCMPRSSFLELHRDSCSRLASFLQLMYVVLLWLFPLRPSQPQFPTTQRFNMEKSAVQVRQSLVSSTHQFVDRWYRSPTVQLRVQHAPKKKCVNNTKRYPRD